jgi:peptidoglycan hydrolase-like protein with peptidoglycan-binding domain
MRTLRLTLKGSDVRLWQAFLRGQKLYGGALDGDFGKLTFDATKAFQHTHSLSEDGVVGNRTLGLAMQLGLELVPNDQPGTDGAGVAPIDGTWLPPAPPDGPGPTVAIDPRVITAHAIGQLPCPNNPPPPVGWSYWKGRVSPALVAFASSVEFKPADFAIGSFVQALVDDQLVAARVEWHDFQGATGKRGCFRGTSLFHPTHVA